MADDNAARKLDTPAETVALPRRVRTVSETDPRFEEFLKDTEGWDDVFDIPAEKRTQG